MTHPHRRTTASTLLGRAVVRHDGTLVGRILDLAVLPIVDATHVYGFIVSDTAGSASRRNTVLFPIVTFSQATNQLELRAGVTPEGPGDPNDFLRLERDLLDQQIIDVHGHKVVRVNDVDLSWESNTDDRSELALRIMEVEVGARGALRRLLKGLPASTIDQVACRFRPNVIPWEFVDLIDRDPARRVKLKVEQNRLSKMHPSDIADILEELAPAERQALFTSLDEQVAAEALEEVKPKMQQALIESMDSGRIADIVEEMDPGAAADLLAELPDERSEAILENMEPEERQEVEDLLEFEGDTAAGRMTTEYVALPQAARVVDAVTAVRDFDGDTELITDVYVLDEDQRLCSIVSLVHLLLAAPETPVSDLPHSHLVSCGLDASASKVAELFDKYNLRSLPVVDTEKKLAGIVHAEQVIAHLRAGQ